MHRQIFTYTRLATGISIIGMIALYAAGCKNASSPEADKPGEVTLAVEVSKAAERPMRSTIDLSGSFAPSQGSAARLTPAVPGRVSKVLVREGDRVKAGQLLATIDQQVQLSQQTSANAAATAAASQAQQSRIAYQSAIVDQQNAVRTAEIGLDQAELERDSSIAQAKLAYEESKADLDKLKAGARPQEILQAHEATVQARAARDRASLELRRNRELEPDGYVSRRQLEDSKTAFDTADSALKAAAASESLIRAGTRKEEIRAQEAHTAALQEALDAAKSIGERKVASAKAMLGQARQGVLMVQAKQKDIEVSTATAKQKNADAIAAAATTALGEIRAPFDGIITRRNLSVGDFADTTSPLLEIAGTGHKFDFVANALPSLAIQIKVNMAASVDFDGASITGHVLSVSPADSTTGLATVRIACEKSAFSGSFSRAHVVIHDYASVVSVPKQSVLERDGKTVVFKVVNGVAKQTEVQAGPEDGEFTAILEGLKPGDTIVQLGAYEVTDGAKIKVVQPESKDADADKSEKKEPGA